MAFLFYRRLTIPLWVVAFFAVALIAPPIATLSLVAVLGIAVIALTTPGLVPWLRASRSVVHGLLQRRRHNGSAVTATVAAPCLRTLDRPNRDTARDALDLVRMDDDAGWQVARPPA